VPLRLTRRRFLGSAAATTLAPLPTCAPHDDRPNVLFVFPDQLRAAALDELAVHGLRTGGFDALRQTSAVFDAALCSNPLCTPARSTLMTGLYPSATAVTGVTVALPLIFPTLSEQLAAAGYHTGFIGKWHLAGLAYAVPPGLQRRGFAEWVAFNRNDHDYTHSTYYTDSDVPQYPNPPETYEPWYQTDFAVDFIERSAGAPWFLMIGYQPPHPPKSGTVPNGVWEGFIPDEFLAKVDAASLAIPANVPPAMAAQARRFLAGYYAATLTIDRCVGRLLDALDDSGQAENTIVVFTSDHGELGGAHGGFGKDVAWEESVRVPLWIRWPARIDPRISLDPVNAADLVPTLLTLTGAEPLATHGTDLSPLLLAGEPVGPPSGYVQCLVGTPDAWHLVRTRGFAYWEREDGADGGLYDLGADPLEQTNLLADPAYATVVDELRAELADWKLRTT
jgi:arylsulfatase A-like enzyme